MTVMKIMVVDDEKDVKSLFEQQFKRELKTGEVEFVFAFSAEEALALLGSLGPAGIVLILSDIKMPGMSGLALLQKLKADYAGLKVFMITAYGDEKNYQTALELGADEFITKPIDFDRLKSLILKVGTLLR
jgi:DNA-binding NtrC family response regulator